MGKNDFCCAAYCSNRRNKRPQLQYYRIPKERKLRQKWLDLIRREGWTPNDYSRLCSEHFIKGKKSQDPDSPSYLPTIFRRTETAARKRETRNSQKTKEVPVQMAVTASRRMRKKSKASKKLNFSVVGRPCSSTSLCHNIKPQTYWNECLPLSDALKEHDYVNIQVDPQSQQIAQDNPELIEKLGELQDKVTSLERENLELKERLISIEDIQKSEQFCRFYTGFPNYRTFKALFDYLEDVAATKRSWRGKETISKHHFSERCQNKPGPDSKLTLEQEFLMVMMRLKVGLLQKDLGRRFGVSEATVSRVFTSWINLMFLEMKNLCEMPRCESSEMAKQFSKFPMVRVILDCTELYTEKPSSLQANKEIYSNYKSHNTFKFLVGISPHPAVVYVSRAWGGRASDKHITSQSHDLIEALNPGEQVMVDRGFAIESILIPRGVELVIPDFKGQGRSQLTETEGINSEKIAEARIHVERAMQRIKVYHILHNEFKLSMAHLADQVFSVCAYLVNFQTPFLK